MSNNKWIFDQTEKSGSVPKHFAAFLFIWLQFLANSHFYCVNILRPETEIKSTVSYSLYQTIDFILFYFPPRINLFSYILFLVFSCPKNKTKKQTNKNYKKPFLDFITLFFVCSIKLSGRGALVVAVVLAFSLFNHSLLFSFAFTIMKSPLESQSTPVLLQSLYGNNT